MVEGVSDSGFSNYYKNSLLVLAWKYTAGEVKKLVLGLLEHTYHDLYIELYVEAKVDINGVTQLVSSLYSAVNKR